MFYVYVIYNQQFQKFYIGQTIDIEQRVRDHNGHIYPRCFTSRFEGEWKLVYKESCSDRSTALKREKQLKSFQGRKFVKSIVMPP